MRVIVVFGRESAEVQVHLAHGIRIDGTETAADGKAETIRIGNDDAIHEYLALVWATAAHREITLVIAAPAGTAENLNSPGWVVECAWDGYDLI